MVSRISFGGLRALAAGTLMVMVTALLACGPHPTGSSSPPSAPGIHWIAVKGTKYRAPADRACAASDLVPTDRGTGIFHGQATEDATIVNATVTQCFVPGAPRVLLLSGGSNTQVSGGDGSVPKIDLAPGQQVEMVIGCDSASQPSATTVRIQLANSQSKEVSGMHLPTPCIHPALLAFQEGPAPTPTGLDAVSVAASLPPSAQLGTTMLYSVTLTNSTSQPVSFSTCPSYTEHLSQPISSTTVRTTEETYVLNCPSIIPANGSLTFAMEMAVPSGWSAGSAKFLWNLETQAQPAAGGVVQLTS